MLLQLQLLAPVTSLGTSSGVRGFRVGVFSCSRRREIFERAFSTPLPQQKTWCGTLSDSAPLEGVGELHKNNDSQQRFEPE